MAKYTIEDIEILRQKSGISYEEAVNLLEYHNGSLARALVDLEKNGRLRSDASSQSYKGLKGVFDYLYRLRLRVRKEDTVIVNLSILFSLLLLFTAPHICIIGLIVSLLLGYRINIRMDTHTFRNATFDDIIKNARSNVQKTVSDFTRQMNADSGKDASAEPRTENAPSGTRPVNVSFSESGSVNVREDEDGYHEADIR